METMQFRYHPIIEGLKVNEDGSELYLNGEKLKIYLHHLPHGRGSRKLVKIRKKTINTIKLVLEAWQGPSPTGEHAARRIDETKGDHYSNLHWGKKGASLSSAEIKVFITKEMVEAVEARRAKGELLNDICKELNITDSGYRKAKRRYGKTE
jgi:hypothetical protein